MKQRSQNNIRLYDHGISQLRAEVKKKMGQSGTTKVAGGLVHLRPEKKRHQAF
jgi:hypothetical protein